MKTMTRALACVGAVAIAMCTVPAASAAEQASITVEQETDLREFLARKHLKASVVERLIDKAEDGIAWDSSTGKNLKDTRTEKDGNFTKTTETFLDGSTNETWIEIPTVVKEGSFSTRSVTGCTRTGTTTYLYKNCIVKGAVSTAVLKFKASYQHANKKVAGPHQPGKITYVTAQSTQNFLGTYSQEYFGIMRGTATGSLSAKAEYRINGGNPGGSQTVRLNLYVSFYGPATSTAS